MTATIDIVASGERELVFTRLFEAPPHLVFEAHIVPALMKRWFNGPDGWKLTTCEIDLREGGAFRYVWTHEDGRVIGLSGTYTEVEPPTRLVATELFDDDWTGGGTINRQDFEAVGDDRTRLVTTVTCVSAEARDAMLKSGMETGIAASFDRLDSMLDEMRLGEQA